MALCYTDGIRSTLNFVASIDTGSSSVDGEADLIVITVQVITTLGRLTAFCGVVSITLEALEALTRAFNADRIGSALNTGARHTTGFWVLQAGFSFHRNWHAHLERVSEEVSLAATVVTARGVETDGIHATGVPNTLVHIDAFHIGVAPITDGTHTVHTIGSLSALSTSATLGSGAVGALLLRLA